MTCYMSRLKLNKMSKVKVFFFHFCSSISYYLSDYQELDVVNRGGGARFSFTTSLLYLDRWNRFNVNSCVTIRRKSSFRILIRDVNFFMRIKYFMHTPVKQNILYNVGCFCGIMASRNARTPALYFGIIY